jgi:hypothetical protein
MQYATLYWADWSWSIGAQWMLGGCSMLLGATLVFFGLLGVTLATHRAPLLPLLVGLLLWGFGLNLLLP